MADPNVIARAYLAAWNEEDGRRRRDLLAESWTENARYVDPMMHSEGRDGIAAMIEGARAQFPEHRFHLVGTPDTHGSYVRFSWTLAPKGGSVVARGTDVVRLAKGDRIAEVVGFLDEHAA